MLINLPYVKTRNTNIYVFRKKKYFLWNFENLFLMLFRNLVYTSKLSLVIYLFSK